MLTSVEAIHVHQLNPQLDGTFTVTFPVGSNTVLSIQENGTIETRPQGANGPFEVAQIVGTALVFAPLGKRGPAYLVPYASEIPND